MTETSILQLEKVVKRYEKKVALDRVSFSMEKGSIFGLLGPNGAGKTTLIRIITTIIGADEGQIYIEGEPLNGEHPAYIGYMPEERGLYKKMKVGEHLMYLAQLKGMPKLEAKNALIKWFEKFEIQDWWHKRVEELSKGMQQKIQFIATVVHRPKLLILDEPFSGLDPINSNLIKSEIYQLHEQGTSIIFSTHRMEQVEAICEHFVLINQGKNILEGNVKTVKDSFKENIFEIVFEGVLPSAFLERINIIEQQATQIRLKLDNSNESNSMLRFLMDNSVKIVAFREILPTLNEIFIKQVNQSNE
ncbi:MAG: ABC transporter ATP-binding protein [Saprospiraceae bacterium]|nr:ABC transporter ATP-binding protein [Saprospiraceae bacterium]